LKKFLKGFFLLLFLGVSTLGFFVYQRYSQNPEQTFPYPYMFSLDALAISLDAPILIVGDRMGVYMAKFQAELAATISQDLSKNIKIQSLAKDGHALHRTLHDLKSLSQWPQIVIFQGASEEYREEKFIPSQVPKILKNFQIYDDDRIQTALILYPLLSRIVYEPIQRVKFTDVLPPYKAPEEEQFLKRMEMEIRLFEKQLRQLVIQSRDRNSMLILTTTPVNLEIEPHKVCGFTTTLEIENGIREVETLLKEENYKGALGKSSKLVQAYTGNARLYFVHGQVLTKVGQIDEAKNALLQSSAYDCDPWRATEIQNSIIRKVARQQQVLLFDFAEMANVGWSESPRFFDEIYPQNLVYEQAMKQLGLVIKSILKL
jgi:hypothetical protein